MNKQDLQHHLDKAFDQRDRTEGQGIRVFVLIEVAEFKSITAALGQQTTEILTGAVQARIQDFLRASDQLLTLSDERCAVILSQIQNTAHLELAAAKLLRQFEAPIDVIDETFDIDIHAAFVVPARAQTTADQLLSEAERTLRDARSSAKGYSITRIGKASAGARDDWRARKAMEDGFERGEFLLHYQPKVHATYRSAVGAEALLRWANPERGMISPGEFIPHLERSPILKPVTWFCIRSAAAACQRWSDSLAVAVNVAPQVLVDNEIVQVLQDTLGLYQLDGARLTVEVTESAFMEDLRQSCNTLEAIRELGVKVSIDDFGTGYASLSYLRDLPADELKIDRSFVAAMHDSPRDLSLVKSIVDIARNFELQIVAEGIEDEDTANVLTELGCGVLQGYYFGRPVPAQEFRAQHVGNAN